MNTFVLLLILLAIGCLVAVALRQGRGSMSRRDTRPGDQAQWPFYIKKALTQPEQVLFHRLTQALPNHIVLAQVQVSRVLGVKKGFNFNEWNNRINRMSYDFIVCSMDSTVVAAIELDDKTHELKAREATDDKKNKATVDAGLKLVRWHVRSLPDVESIQREFLSKATNE